MQRQVAQAGVLGGADAVLGSGAAAVPQFQVCELAAGGVGDETDIPCRSMSSCECCLCAGAEGLLVVGLAEPSGCFVVWRAGLEASVQDPDEPVGDVP